MNRVDIYTDGACKGNPGPGGWGVLLQGQGAEKELFGGALQTTNNRMEMQAVIEALSALKRPCQVVLHVDSQYVLKGMTEWLPGWKARGWVTAGKTPVKNLRPQDTRSSGAGCVVIAVTRATNAPINWPTGGCKRRWPHRPLSAAWMRREVIDERAV